ncbi:glutamate synthase subunit beta [Cryptosporangium arvum]|uniref:glutamate synthase subunit beta n=1 Tax=Cryptosporangium arvum TaxID=80871 RepID=UPI0004B88A14|nr:glutamate synthase subunit beta [Cryptosporangium arvum]
MADPQGFLKNGRELPVRRPVDIRITDWREVYEEFPEKNLRTQASRCMDCGIPFCHNGCPLGNLIPEWNDLARTGQWSLAIDRLHATNNFPEFTGKLCPAPCEAACVLGIADDPVTIKQIEVETILRAFDDGLVKPQLPEKLSGKKVAVIGSGPAGLAAAQQLTRAGHEVTVYERADKIGGLLRYGIPEFKMEKSHIDRRLAQMEAEGTKFVTGVTVGSDLPVSELDADAIVLATGSTVPRDLPAPGRELNGIHAAMEYLVPANKAALGDPDPDGHIDVRGKHVVIIGGGDTGADCLGTAHRQGAKSVTQLEIMPQPPEARAGHMPWPTYPMLYRVTSAHEEGGERVYAVNTEKFVGDDAGNVRAIVLHEVVSEGGKFVPVEGTSREIPAEAIFLAMGFVGVEKGPLYDELGVEIDERGRVVRDATWKTAADNVFVTGDAGRGQSLIVWAIAEGRATAAAVDKHLAGSTFLPSPILPTTMALTAR